MSFTTSQIIMAMALANGAAALKVGVGDDVEANAATKLQALARGRAARSYVEPIRIYKRLQEEKLGGLNLLADLEEKVQVIEVDDFELANTVLAVGSDYAFNMNDFEEVMVNKKGKQVSTLRVKRDGKFWNDFHPIYFPKWPVDEDFGPEVTTIRLIGDEKPTKWSGDQQKLSRFVSAKHAEYGLQVEPEYLLDPRDDVRIVAPHGAAGHGDDVLAGVLCFAANSMDSEFQRLVVIRTRHPKFLQAIVDKGGILFDVGGEYNGENRFDHHQGSFSEAYDQSFLLKPNSLLPLLQPNSLLAASGLIYRHYEDQILDYFTSQLGEYAKDLVSRQFRLFVLEVDAIDTGNGQSPHVQSSVTDFSQRISRSGAPNYRHSLKKFIPSDHPAECFKRMMRMAAEELIERAAYGVSEGSEPVPLAVDPQALNTSIESIVQPFDQGEHLTEAAIFNHLFDKVIDEKNDLSTVRVVRGIESYNFIITSDVHSRLMRLSQLDINGICIVNSVLEEYAAWIQHVAVPEKKMLETCIEKYIEYNDDGILKISATKYNRDLHAQFIHQVFHDKGSPDNVLFAIWEEKPEVDDNAATWRYHAVNIKDAKAVSENLMVAPTSWRGIFKSEPLSKVVGLSAIESTFCHNAGFTGGLKGDEQDARAVVSKLIVQRAAEIDNHTFTNHPVECLGPAALRQHIPTFDGVLTKAQQRLDTNYTAVGQNAEDVSLANCPAAEDDLHSRVGEVRPLDTNF